MILAAGFGTRLRPYTGHTPKALFPIDGQPIIDRTIRNLIDAGCEAIVINTHYLHGQIEDFISAQPYPVPVQIHYEPKILGTGGGIKNAADFFDDRPFIVMNGDIVTDIPLQKLYAYHCTHTDPVTLALCNRPEINTVRINGKMGVLGFDGHTAALESGEQRRTFTGIQVLDPIVLDEIPATGFSSIIDTYRRIITRSCGVRAYMADHCHWNDLGTPQSYRAEVIDTLASRAFGPACRAASKNKIHQKSLAGDGSDRQWYRLSAGNRTLIMVDHGIRSGEGSPEADAYIDIGRHLHHRSVAVPELIAWDRFAGLVLMEDLGDNHLQDLIRKTNDPEQVMAVYKQVIDQWVRLATSGYDGFDPAWTHQTRCYDRGLILENECRYFVDAFLNGYLDLKIDRSRFQTEFRRLADKIMEHAIDGLIHRDCQSRNIMIKAGHYYLIDFQGARFGPVQYDLASLLIDPYVALPIDLQTRLCHYGCDRFHHVKPIDQHRFITGYRYCALSRNLQVLGAFGYLTRVKKKTQFKAYIPAAVRSLDQILDTFRLDQFPVLKSVTDCIKKKIDVHTNRRNCK